MLVAPARLAEDFNPRSLRSVYRPPQVALAVRAEHPSILYQNFPWGFIIFFARIIQTPAPSFSGSPHRRRVSAAPPVWLYDAAIQTIVEDGKRSRGFTAFLYFREET
jgi:hypothetical protein